MTTMLWSPARRRRSGVVLLAHLTLLGLLPMAEVMHQHGPAAELELHGAGEDCEHESHPAECTLLRVASVPALPAPDASPDPTAGVIVAPVSPTSPVGLPDEPASPALPRAPPLA